MAQFAQPAFHGSGNTLWVEGKRQQVAKAWEAAVDRARILRGRPMPGSLRPVAQVKQRRRARIVADPGGRCARCTGHELESLAIGAGDNERAVNGQAQARNAHPASRLSRSR